VLLAAAGSGETQAFAALAEFYASWRAPRDAAAARAWLDRAIAAGDATAAAVAARLGAAGA
jgi:TPR repeat protein